MFKVRGVNMFPKQVEELLAKVEGTSSEYAIRIAREEGTNKDVMLLTVECDGKYDFNQISAQIMEKFKALIGMTPNKVIVVPIGTLPRSEKKTKRVTDDRQL